MKPLEGITVLDFTQAYSGPYCAMNLADYGARVIKVERADYGDQSRDWGPYTEDDGSGYFAFVSSLDRRENHASVAVCTSTANSISLAKPC